MHTSGQGAEIMSGKERTTTQYDELAGTVNISLVRFLLLILYSFFLFECFAASFVVQINNHNMIIIFIQSRKSCPKCSHGCQATSGGSWEPETVAHFGYSDQLASLGHHSLKWFCTVKNISPNFVPLEATMLFIIHLYKWNLKTLKSAKNKQSIGWKTGSRN